MAVYNIAATRHKNEQIENMHQRIQQRLGDYQDFSGSVKAGVTGRTSPTFSSLLTSIAHSPEERQKHTMGMASFFNDLSTLIEALPTGDKTNIRNALDKLQASLKDTLSQNPQAETLAADLKTLKDAVQAGDPEALQAALLQLRTDCQSLAQTCLQNSMTGLQPALAALQTKFDSNLNTLLASADTQSDKITGAVNAGLQKFLKVLSSGNSSSLIGAGIAGLASVIGGRINTSA